MSSVVFQTSKTTSAIFKGKSKEQQLTSLPSVEKLLEMALYPIKTRASSPSGERRVTLQIEHTEDEGVYAKVVQNLRIPNGVVPDINLVDYLIKLNSENYGLSPKEFLEKVDNEGGKDNFQTYYFNLTLFVETIS
jgi:hypothetical protein